MALAFTISLLILFIVGAILFGGLWSVGAFSNNYTQSINGKRYFLISSGLAVLACGSSALFGILQTRSALNLLAVVGASLATLLAVGWWQMRKRTHGDEKRERFGHEGEVGNLDRSTLLKRLERDLSVPLSRDTASRAAAMDLDRNTVEMLNTLNQRADGFSISNLPDPDNGVE